MDMDKFERSAIDTLENAGYPKNDSPTDIVGVAKTLGFVVGNAVLDDNDDGFIIAHEIGHYVLEYKEKNMSGMYANRYHERGHNNSENEIDFFAANLLMLRDLFVKKYQELKLCQTGDLLIKSLAEYFVVTVKMTERRVEELGLA